VESPDAHRPNVFAAGAPGELRRIVIAVTIVAIDGPTGVGKSTTSRAIAERLGADLLLDPVSVSPLLDDYYTGEATPSAALASELAFLRSRAELLASAEPDRLVVADFTVLRTAPFAEFLGDPGDRRRVLDEMRRLMVLGPRIDVLVLLSAQPESLLERVRTRDRRAEVDLTIEHLVELRRHFASWREELLAQADTSIEIDTASWDPRRSDHLDELLARITESLP
jgi:deoxyadenosine/deoxycytidine kinase